MRFLRALTIAAALALCTLPPPAAAADDLTVMVAKRNIPKDFKIDETMVTFRQVPREYVQPNALRRIDEILGQVTAVTIFEGAQITSTQLLSIEDAGLAFKIPKGFRSLTLPLESGAPIGDVRPGNYVDLVHVRPLPGGKLTEAVTLLQNVYVLAVGDDLGQAVPVNEGGDARPARTRRAKADTISVMLTPDEVQKVALAQDTGGIRISLRSLWEGNTQVPLEKSTAPLPIRTPFPAGSPKPAPTAAP